MFIKRLLDGSEDIINILFILLKVYSRGYVMDENVEQVCITHAKCLRHIDGALSFLWQVEPARESIRESRYFVAAYMKT